MPASRYRLDDGAGGCGSEAVLVGGHVVDGVGRYLAGVEANMDDHMKMVLHDWELYRARKRER